MKKELLIVGAILILILLTVGLSGCMDEKNKFIGSWQAAGGGTITFNSNNTVVIIDIGMFGFIELTGVITHSVANQQITFSVGSIGKTLNYSFPNSNTLILTNDAGLSLTLTKM